MRNDARPIGENAHDSSPVDGQQTPDDARETVKHDRQSHIVNRETQEQSRRPDADIDPAMPTGDSSLPTKI